MATEQVGGDLEPPTNPILDYAAEQEIKSALESYPQSPEKNDIWKWTYNVLQEEDPNKRIKIGYLRQPELGLERFPMRIRMLWDIFLESEYGLSCPAAEFMGDKAAMSSDTSLSRDGILLKLPSMQTKRTHILGDKKTTVKKGLLGETRTEEGGSQDGEES